MMSRVTVAFIAVALFSTSSFGQEKSAANCDYRRMDSILVVQANVPLYPPLAAQAHVSGTVDVRILVKGGSIVSADVIPGAHPILAAFAKGNVETWKFAPQSYGDFCVRYVYELDKEESVGLSNSRVEVRFPDWVKITAAPPKPTCSDCTID